MRFIFRKKKQSSTLNDFKVHILGSAAAVPTLTRNASGQLLLCNNRLILLDCGEGTQLQLRKFNLPIQRINTILISHLHGDHFYGLPGLLSTMSLLGRTAGIKIYGPSSLQIILDAMFNASQTHPLFPYEFIAIKTSEKQVVFEDAGVKMSAFPLQHRIETYGFSIEEKWQRFSLDMNRVVDAGLTKEHLKLLATGTSFRLNDGRWIEATYYTKPKPNPRVYSYCSDTKPFSQLSGYLLGTTTLYHESTFLHNLKKRANDTFHSTAKDAAVLAQKIQVKKLLLGHFSSRYDDISLFESEAQTIIPEVYAVRDGDCFSVV